MDASLLIYDIPEGRGIPNPSRRLRRIGIRVNLSCWVMRSGDIPYRLLHTLAARGVTWHVVKFDAGEGDKLLGMMRDAIRREIRENIERAQRTIRAARERLDGSDGDNPAEQRARLRRYLATTRTVRRRLDELIRSFNEAATRFGVDPAGFRLSDAGAVVRAISAGMHNRARVYAESIDALAVVEGGRSAMGNVANADGVDQLIFADYMEDFGLDATELRTVFAWN